MFEGLVRQLLLGYLGRYIKDFHREQLKITFWNEEVLFENVELILEAFDYLRLPFALKQGRVGRLSIKIPWKKLGWDPIIILLEDVFFSAGQREDHEWSADTVEKRELAAKKARLATAELAKLSRRVCDSQAGQSFMSHITGRILDNIQISMKNVHILYSDMQSDTMQVLFGIRFTSLMVMKHSPAGSSTWTTRSSQVSKIVEIQGLGIYCTTFKGSLNLVTVDAARESKWGCNPTTEGDDYILVPFDVSLLVMKSGKLEHDAPQYSVTAVLTKLVMSIDSDQLQHILALSDSVRICQLREMYGRYRPLGGLLLRKSEGWEKAWWHYAQNAVLSDVRKKLKKSSWRYLGERLSCRGKYVKLYRRKLIILQREQTVDEDVMREVEEMEKDIGVEDILNFRSSAERQLEESLSSFSSDLVDESTTSSAEMSLKDDNSSSRSRGWLNWLSRGVLGAGGTDDSSQFSGVVSDDIIKDICEATKFQPMPLLDGEASANTVPFLATIKLTINQISLTLRSISLGREVAELSLDGVSVKCKVWDGSETVKVKVVSAGFLDSFKETTVLRTGRLTSEMNEMEDKEPSTCLQFEVTTNVAEADLSVKVTLQPLQIDFNLESFLNLMDFYNVLKSVQLQEDRVLDSLNGIEDTKSRMLSKAEHFLSSRRKVLWDVNLVDISFSLPWSTENLEDCSLVMKVAAFHISSDCDECCSNILVHSVNNYIATDASNAFSEFQIQELYAFYEVKFSDLEILLMVPCFLQEVSVIEKVQFSVVIASCIIPKEIALKKLQAQISIPSLHVHLSPSIYGAIVRAAEYVNSLYLKSEQEWPITVDALDVQSVSLPFNFFVAANIDLFKLVIDLENDCENSSCFMFSLQQLSVRYDRADVEDGLVYVKTMEISTYNLGAQDDSLILWSSRFVTVGSSVQQHELGSHNSRSSDQHQYADGCFHLEYRDCKKKCFSQKSCSVSFADIELHCYPKVFGSLIEFCNKMDAFHRSGNEENSAGTSGVECSTEYHNSSLKRFGFSNFHENNLAECASITLDRFPFVTISNSGSLPNLEGSLRCAIPNWRSNLKSCDKRIRSERSSDAFKRPVGDCSEAGGISSSGHSMNPVLLTAELNLTNIHVQFHDASSPVGRVNVPVGRVLISTHADCLDVLCSTEGLTLSSPWWSNNDQDLLWAPLLPDKPPILNVRMRRGINLSADSNLELSFGIHHVCCILPPDFLALLIGYFSLPDWSMIEGEDEAKDEHLPNTQHIMTILYKFEVLDSALMSPVGGDDAGFLKVDIKEFYGSFIENDALGNRFVDTLPECLVHSNKVADRSNSLNMFGRNLSLLFLFCDNGSNSSGSVLDTDSHTCTLIQSLNADMWIRMPSECQFSQCSSIEETLYPRCIMAKVGSCEIAAEDPCFSSGVEALVHVLDQYSSIDVVSKCFTGDIEQFFRLKKSLKDNPLVPVGASSLVLTEIRICAELLSIKLCCTSTESKTEEMSARLDTKLVVLASLENESVLSLDAQFSSVALFSSPRSLMLAKCSSGDSFPAALDMHITSMKNDQVELVVLLPSFEVWLYTSDWLTVIFLIEFYFKPFLNSSVENPSQLAQRPPDNAYDLTVANSLLPQESPHVETENVVPSGFSFNLRSDNLGISCYIPVAASEDPSPKSEDAIAGGKESKFVTVALQSQCFKLSTDSTSIKVRFTLEKVTGSVRIDEANIIHSWPFFQLSQLCTELEVDDYKMVVPLHVEADIGCESFDIWLSHQVLYFWNQIEFDNSRADDVVYVNGQLDLKIQLRRVSLLLTDGRWTCNGPLMELLLRNFLLEICIVESRLQLSMLGKLYINYNNIHKVLWESFVEPWNFQLALTRGCDMRSAQDSGIVTDAHVMSTSELNINVTESLIEVMCRAIEMVEDARDLMQVNSVGRSNRLNSYQCFEDFCSRRYAPYVIRNMTSLPFKFHIHQGLVTGENIDVSALKQEFIVLSGSSVPIYVDDELDEEVFHHKPPHSSDGLNKKHSNGVGHHFMTIQFEGTTSPSEFISMDLVGLTYFEVDFSKGDKAEQKSRLLVPVVFDVSVQRYTKLIQLYSTVILTNSTSTPLELRFDIPFGISPKIVDPLYPGQEFPLPLHLAEAGHISWRPLGNNYLWGEYHNLSSILSQEGRRGFLRSLVCYPSLPSSDPFRCCLSVQDICLPFAGGPKTGSSLSVKGNLKHWTRNGGQPYISNQRKARFIHRVILSTPLVVKNYLPESVSVTIESGGTSRSYMLEKVETSFFHTDSSHDLRITFHLDGFEPSTVKVPRAETFGAAAKSNGTVLSLMETVMFNSHTLHGPVYGTVEMQMDESSGARELCISVPFLLYNCTGFSLSILNSECEAKGNHVVVPSCYNCTEQELFISQTEGLGLLLSDSSSRFRFPHLVGQSCKSSNSGPKLTIDSVNNNVAKPVIYSPDPSIPATEIMVKLSMSVSERTLENLPISSWSAAFFLVVPSGSTTVLVPQPSTSSAAVVSVTSSLLDVAFSGRTRAICFQPRYVICNACSKDLCFKQKGTDVPFRLGAGQHSHLHWPDTTRELLVSVRFDDPGWQWSGCFSPDHPGDQLVKMRNFLSSALNMIRVEVQNADDVCTDEKMTGSAFRNSGTNFILLSDDNTGFIPYRIENLSKETLRVYQQKCETLGTIIHPNISWPYAWDEPCYPHRLVVEVPGERVIGCYTLDEVKDYKPVRLQSLSEKHERTLFFSVLAEGAMKVLRVTDSSFHVRGDQRDLTSGIIGEKRRHDEREEKLAGFKEQLTVSVSCVGISLINSYPQEILFICAKDIKIGISQTVEQQKLSFHILSLQIDNQLRGAQYPVVLYFDQVQRGFISGHIRGKNTDRKIVDERVVPSTPSSSCEPVISLSAAKWRNKDMALVSFECISLRIADFHLELDQELLLSLIDFFRAAVLTFKSLDSIRCGLKINSSDIAFYVSERSDASQNQLFPNFDRGDVKKSPLPEVVPVGAPWQAIHLLARRHNKIYVEAFFVSSIKMTLSFSSNPWMLKNGALLSRESLIQRGLMALADVEGANIHLKKLTITHHIASWESFREIVSKHYAKQFLHEMYKVFGSAGVIGNPMGFARRVGHGIKDFLSVPARGVFESPAGLIMGMAHGTTSLLSNTMYAVSDAATQFTKAAHKGVLALTLNDQDLAQVENQQMASSLHSKGVISELLEGLTGLLQSPIKGAEKHGLPGVLSGFALGVTGLVARPAASVLEATGRTAQSIRNRSKLHRMGYHSVRVRLPRPLSRESALRPYSWEEAVGTAVLLEADDDGLSFKDEVLVLCKALKEPGKFLVLTEQLMLVVNCPSLVDLGTPEFRGIAIDPEWVIEVEICLENVIHADYSGGVVHIVGSRSQTLVRQTQLQRQGQGSVSSGGGRVKWWDKSPSPLPLFQTSLELRSEEDAEAMLEVLLKTIKQGKDQGCGNVHLLHQSSLR